MQEGQAIDRILVFIPTFSDHAAIDDLVAAIAELGQVFVPLLVDDGSVPPVAVPGGRCLHARLPANMGLGVSTHIAFSHALRHGYTAVVRVDADGQHAVHDIPRLINALGDADFVVGVRTNHDSDGSLDGLGRRLMKAYFNMLARALTGGRVPHDVNSGFFAANREALRRLSRDTFERFPEPEIFVSACRADLRVVSVLVEQLPRRTGRSTLGMFAALRMFFRFNVFAFNRILRGRQP